MTRSVLAALAALLLASAPASAQAPNDIASKLREGDAYTQGRASRHARASQNTPRAHRFASRSSGSRSSGGAGADHSADQLNAQQLQQHGS